MKGSMKGTPGSQGNCGFGHSFRQETSNLQKNSLPMSQTVASPGKGPGRTNGGGKSPGMVKFGPAKVPHPAKNRVGFTTSD